MPGTSSNMNTVRDYKYGGNKKSGLSQGIGGKYGSLKNRMATNLQGKSVREGRMKDLRKQKAELIKTLKAQISSLHQAVGKLEEAEVAETSEPPGAQTGHIIPLIQEAVNDTRNKIATTQNAINLVNAKIKANQK